VAGRPGRGPRPDLGEQRRPLVPSGRLGVVVAEPAVWPMIRPCCSGRRLSELAASR